MQKAIDDFRRNMLRVRNLGGIYQALSKRTTKAIDISDILRSQIVLGVSALDYYVHEVTFLGMIEVFNGTRLPTPAFLRFRISMDSVLSIAGSNKSSDWFENEVREHHSFLSFQNSDNIADAIRLFSQVKLWQEVGEKLSIPEELVKQQIRLIVDRRNKIAHEADMNPSYPGERWPITETDVNNALEFIEKVCEAIHLSVG